MGEPRVSACSPWASLDDVTRLRGAAAAATPGLADLLAVATDLLYEATGGRWPGSCEDTVRPCGRWTGSAFGPAYHGTVLDGAFALGWAQDWQRSWGGCACNMPLSRQCSCVGLSQVTLGGEPLTSVVEVLIDGQVIPPAWYTVHDNRWLVGLRKDDGTLLRFPCCQDLSKPTTEVDTWQVTFTYGTLPPSDGVLACVDLALELAKGSAGGDCALPPRVTSMIRQGVQVALIDPLAIVASGGFGVYSVDLFVGRYPKHRPATIHVPGRPRVVRDTGAS